MTRVLRFVAVVLVLAMALVSPRAIAAPDIGGIDSEVTAATCGGGKNCHQNYYGEQCVYHSNDNYYTCESFGGDGDPGYVSCGWIPWGSDSTYLCRHPACWIPATCTLGSAGKSCTQVNGSGEFYSGCCEGF